MSIIYIILIIICIYFCYCGIQYSNFKSNFDNKTTILWFYSPQCGHCVKMEPEWNEFNQLLNLYPYLNITTKKIDVRLKKNNNLVKKYNISSVPFVIKIKNGQSEIFSEKRLARNFLKWSQS